MNSSKRINTICIVALMFGAILMMIHVSHALKCYSGSYVGVVNQSVLSKNLTQVSTTDASHVCFSYKVGMDGVSNNFGEMAGSECSAIKTKSSPQFDVVCCSTDMCNNGNIPNSASGAAVSALVMICAIIAGFLF